MTEDVIALREAVKAIADKPNGGEMAVLAKLLLAVCVELDARPAAPKPSPRTLSDPNKDT